MNTQPTSIPFLSGLLPAVTPSPVKVEGDSPPTDSYAILFQMLLGLQAATPADPSASLLAMADVNPSAGNASLDQMAALTSFMPPVTAAEGTPLGIGVTAHQPVLSAATQAILPAPSDADLTAPYSLNPGNQPDAVAPVVTKPGAAPVTPEVSLLMMSPVDLPAATGVASIIIPDIHYDGTDLQVTPAIVPDTAKKVLEPLVFAAAPEGVASKDVASGISGVSVTWAAPPLIAASMVPKSATAESVNQHFEQSPITWDLSQGTSRNSNATPAHPTVPSINYAVESAPLRQSVEAASSDAPPVRTSDSSSAIATAAQIIADLPADPQFRISINAAAGPKAPVPAASTAAMNDSTPAPASEPNLGQEQVVRSAAVTTPDQVAALTPENAAHGEVLTALPVPGAAPRAKIKDVMNVPMRRSEPVETSVESAAKSDTYVVKPAPSTGSYRRDYDVTATQTSKGSSTTVPSGAALVPAPEPSVQPVLEARAADVQTATVKSEESVPAPVVSRVIVETPRPLSIPGQITVRLEPPQLGRLRIDLSSNLSGVVGRLRFQSETARTAVQSDLGSLRQALADAGVRVDRLEVTAASTDNGGRPTLERHAPFAGTDRSPSGRNSDKGHSNTPWREDRPRKERQNQYGAPPARSPWSAYPMNALAVNMVA